MYNGDKEKGRRVCKEGGLVELGMGNEEGK
jgi:hypothetical protein